MCNLTSWEGHGKRIECDFVWKLQKRENRSGVIAAYLNLEDKFMAFYTMYKLMYVIIIMYYSDLHTH